MVITFARKYGNAVERNRARRVHREAYRLMKGRLAAGYDLVLLMYPETNQAMGLAEGAGRLEILFKKAGIR
jgi:ribonuclease P protein component